RWIGGTGNGEPPAGEHGPGSREPAGLTRPARRAEGSTRAPAPPRAFWRTRARAFERHARSGFAPVLEGAANRLVHRAVQESLSSSVRHDLFVWNRRLAHRGGRGGNWSRR